MAADPPRILIAERDEGIRDLQQYFLERAGFSFDFAADGQVALDTALLNPPALIIAEILIPGIDGLALCRRLHDDPVTADIPVLIFSILNAGARAREAGAKGFLRKPLIESTFIATIHKLIAAHPVVSKEPQWTSH
jgi:two-component system, OmpR family, alkaline phosphatase synthesis response regulator PhoP